MKKVFTLLTLLVAMVTSAWADEAILSWNMGANGEAASSANSITGAKGCAAEGFTIAITGNTGKKWSAGNGNITYKTVNYKTLKNSNGAQNTVTCPSGKVATKVVFYAVTNDASTKAQLSEFDGTKCSDEVTSLKDYDNPTVITKAIDNKNSFTFTFSTKQVCLIAVVTYTEVNTNAPTITTQPVGGNYVDGYTIPALTVTATASAGDLSYQWYKCDDAVKTNAAAISGATNASYTPNKSSFYFCVVSDSNGSTDSDVVEVTISPAAAPSFVSLTASATNVPRGATSTITAEIAGNPAPTIQWYSNTENKNTGGTAIDGATGLTLKLVNAAIGTFYYYAVAHNSEGNAASDVVAITVTDPDVHRTGYNTYYVAKDDVVVSGAKVLCDDITMEYSTADYKTASEDNSISTLNANYVAYVTSSTNGWGVTFTPSVAGVLSVGVIINGDKEFAVSNVTSFSYNGLQDEGAETPMSVSTGTNEGKTWKPEKKQYTIITIDVIKGANYSFNVSGSKMCLYGFEFTPTEGSVSAKVAASGYTTYASASALDFANAVEEGTTNKTLTAFVVSNVTKESVTLTPVESAPASTGVVLKGTASTTYTIPVVKSAASVGTNKLTASVSGATVEANSVYVVSGGKFCLYTGTSIPAGKAYLPKSEVPASASELTLDFNGEATGISTVDSSKKSFLDGDFYNLAGQRVAQPTKGLYIVNGRKVVIK